jgi:hypothetical protein
MTVAGAESTVILLEGLPTIIGALIALGGTIALFWLQQSSARRAQRNRTIDAAMREVMTAFSHLIKGFGVRGGPNPTEDLQQSALRLVWLLAGKDKAVAESVVIRANHAVNGLAGIHSASARADKVSKVRTDVVIALSEWRAGERSTKWFESENAKFAPR